MTEQQHKKSLHLDDRKLDSSSVAQMLYNPALLFQVHSWHSLHTSPAATGQKPCLSPRKTTGLSHILSLC